MEPRAAKMIGSLDSNIGRVLAGPAAMAEAAGPPNILYILADDMGYADLSSYGAQGYTTPVLDELASEGMRFTDAYANAPICSPTRTALVTGRYQQHFQAGLEEPNVRFPPGSELPADTPTIASMLKDAGYRTHLVGKWHVTRIPDFGPQHYGYDTFFGIAAGAADYFLHASNSVADDPTRGLHEGDTPVARDGYLTDIIADEAIQEIKADDGKPFFMSLHFTAPHWPWEGPEDEAYARQLKDVRDAAGGSLETYAKMIGSLDSNIGRVLAALDESGIADNTIVVFTSDNGGERFSNTWPFIGYKGELLEGGIRVPMIVRWPGHVPAGAVSEQVTISMDTVPTFLAAAGAPAPAETDGVDLLPQWLGQGEPVERTLFWRMRAGDQAAVRSGDWKYVRLGGKEHLFDLGADQRERADQKDVHPEIMADLRAKWDAWNGTILPYPATSFSESVADHLADRYPEPVREEWMPAGLK